jgi:hypothetical protein
MTEIALAIQTMLASSDHCDTCDWAASACERLTSSHGKRCCTRCSHAFVPSDGAHPFPGGGGAYSDE